MRLPVRLASLVLLVIISIPSPTAAQVRQESPFAAVVTPAPPEEDLGTRARPDEPSHKPSVGSAILGSLAGSALGMIAATAIGPRVADASTEPYVTYLGLVLAGSIAGSTLGAGLVTDNFGRALLGSVTGTVAGLWVTASGGALVFPLIQASFAGTAAAR